MGQLYAYLITPPIQQQYLMNESVPTTKKIKHSKKPNYNILLLGSTETGKTTVLNHMRMCSGISDKFNGRVFYENPKDDLSFSEKELLVYKKYIDENIFQTTKVCLQTIRKYNESFVNPENETFCDEFLKFPDFKIFDEVGLSHQIIRSLSVLWDENIMLLTLKKYQDVDFNLSDGVSYLVKPENIVRFSSRHPQIVQEDILHLYRKTNVVSKTRFEFDSLNFVFIDVGGKLFDQVSKSEKIIDSSKGRVVIYVISLSEYNQNSTKNIGKTKMDDSLALFEKIVSMKSLEDVPWLILFNKVDVFESKLDQFDLRYYFEYYHEKDDPVEFITRQFLSKAKHLIYEYKVMSAFDQNSVVDIIQKMEEKLNL
eukprot:gene4537-7914_t